MWYVAENAAFEYVLLYPQCFKTVFSTGGLTNYHTNPGFDTSAVQIFWKHCWKRTNCSYGAISPTTMLSNHLENFLPFSSTLKLSSANSFCLEEFEICRLGKSYEGLFHRGLTLSLMTNSRLFKTQSVCRWQLQIQWKWQKVLQTDRKHCGKRRNCFFSFSNSVFERLALQTHI